MVRRKPSVRRASFPAPYVGQFLGRNGDRIAVEHDQIGEIAGHEPPPAVLVAGEPGGGHGRRLERLLRGDGLLGMPGGPVVERAQDAGANAHERVELLHGRVGSVHDDGARVEERAPRIGAVGHPGPGVLRQVAVGWGVGELHGRGDADRLEARDVLPGEELRVLDARAQAAGAPLVRGRLEAVERVAVRLVADRVDGDGEPGPRGAAHDLGELVAARDLDAGAVQQARGARAERPVHEDLDVAEPQQVVAEPAAQAERLDRVELLVRERLPYAQRRARPPPGAPATTGRCRSSRPCRERR